MFSSHAVAVGIQKCISFYDKGHSYSVSSINTRGISVYDEDQLPPSQIGFKVTSWSRVFPLGEVPKPAHANQTLICYVHPAVIIGFV